jgi:hypothetical protein
MHVSPSRLISVVSNSITRLGTLRVEMVLTQKEKNYFSAELVFRHGLILTAVIFHASDTISQIKKMTSLND